MVLEETKLQGMPAVESNQVTPPAMREITNLNMKTERIKQLPVVELSLRTPPTMLGPRPMREITNLKMKTERIKELLMLSRRLLRRLPAVELSLRAPPAMLEETELLNQAEHIEELNGQRWPWQRNGPRSRAEAGGRERSGESCQGSRGLERFSMAQGSTRLKATWLNAAVAWRSTWTWQTTSAQIVG